MVINSNSEEGKAFIIIIEKLGRDERHNNKPSKTMPVSLHQKAE